MSYAELSEIWEVGVGSLAVENIDRKEKPEELWADVWTILGFPWSWQSFSPFFDSIGQRRVNASLRTARPFQPITFPCFMSRVTLGEERKPKQHLAEKRNISENCPFYISWHSSHISLKANIRGIFIFHNDSIYNIIWERVKKLCASLNLNEIRVWDIIINLLICMILKGYKRRNSCVYV